MSIAIAVNATHLHPEDLGERAHPAVASEHDTGVIVAQQHTQGLHRTPHTLTTTPSSTELPADPRRQGLRLCLQVLFRIDVAIDEKSQHSTVARRRRRVEGRGWRVEGARIE